MTEKKEIFHPWGKANINQTELWLSHLAEEGWALESVQGWRFIFVLPLRITGVTFCIAHSTLIRNIGVVRMIFLLA